MRWHRRSAVFRSSSCLCSVAVFVYLVRLFAAFFRQSLVACVLQIRSFAFQSSAVRCTFISRCSCRSPCFLRVVVCFASHPLISRSLVVTVFGFVVVSWPSLFVHPYVVRHSSFASSVFASFIFASSCGACFVSSFIALRWALTNCVMFGVSVCRALCRLYWIVSKKTTRERGPSSLCVTL